MRTRKATFFEVGIKVPKIQEDGTAKAVTEQYVVDAISFAEAENNIGAYASEYYSEHHVLTEKIARFKEVVLNDTVGLYFKVTLEYTTLDERTGKEKNTKEQILVEAISTADAELQVNSFMKDTMVEYKIVTIAETKFMDVIEHTTEAK